MAASPLVWDRRIAVMATFAFIRAGDFRWTFRLADRLLRDPHDLVHKAVGWMLREVGNRDRAAEEAFLADRHRVMPRVMLRRSRSSSRSDGGGTCARARIPAVRPDPARILDRCAALAAEVDLRRLWPVATP
ncbi:DNA alkylation repair protein [Micromonospora orduensis]|uniref:DNA alkylation repair protein n=1 Tax=Micromonospora orduensis TaxID=1420891 RepID=UPI0033F16FA3